MANTIIAITVRVKTLLRRCEMVPSRRVVAAGCRHVFTGYLPQKLSRFSAGKSEPSIGRLIARQAGDAAKPSRETQCRRLQLRCQDEGTCIRSLSFREEYRHDFAGFRPSFFLVGGPHKAQPWRAEGVAIASRPRPVGPSRSLFGQGPNVSEPCNFFATLGFTIQYSLG